MFVNKRLGEAWPTNEVIVLDGFEEGMFCW